MQWIRQVRLSEEGDLVMEPREKQDGETCVVSPDKTQEPGLQVKTTSLFSATVSELEQGHLPSCAVLELVVLLAQCHGCWAENCWLQPPLRPAFPLSLP